jgi:hypothetical protein
MADGVDGASRFMANREAFRILFRVPRLVVSQSAKSPVMSLTAHQT